MQTGSIFECKLRDNAWRFILNCTYLSYHVHHYVIHLISEQWMRKTKMYRLFQAFAYHCVRLDSDAKTSCAILAFCIFCSLNFQARFPLMFSTCHSAVAQMSLSTVFQKQCLPFSKILIVKHFGLLENVVLGNRRQYSSLESKSMLHIIRNAYSSIWR